MCKNKGIFCYNDNGDKDDYCIYCVKNGYAGANEVKKAYVIPKVSKSLAANKRAYNKEVKEWLKENNKCQAKVKCKGTVATQCHHQKGREGDLLMDKEHWLPVCDKCHNWITEHSLEAIEKGLSISRHKVNTKN